jgi:hypothetical protein
MYSGKDLAELSGYTSRVYSLLSSLHALDDNVYPENPRPASLEDGTVGLSCLAYLVSSVDREGILRPGQRQWPGGRRA